MAGRCVAGRGCPRLQRAATGAVRGFRSPPDVRGAEAVARRTASGGATPRPAPDGQDTQVLIVYRRLTSAWSAPCAGRHWSERQATRGSPTRGWSSRRPERSAFSSNPSSPARCLGSVSTARTRTICTGPRRRPGEPASWPERGLRHRRTCAAHPQRPLLPDREPARTRQAARGRSRLPYRGSPPGRRRAARVVPGPATGAATGPLARCGRLTLPARPSPFPRPNAPWHPAARMPPPVHRAPWLPSSSFRPRASPGRWRTPPSQWPTSD